MLNYLRRALFCAAIVGLLPTMVAAIETNGQAAFRDIFGHYEAARLALTGDTKNGVPEAARAINKVLRNLEDEWSPSAAGIGPESSKEIQRLIPQMLASSSALAEASTMDETRQAFYELTKPLVRWRQALLGEKPVVAFCSMKKRSWLQPRGELTNPYYGQEMLTCGEVVDG